MDIPLSRSTTVTSEEPMCSFEEESEGLTTKQKLAVGFIWLVAGIYSVMSNSILSKGHTVKHHYINLICNKTQFKQYVEYFNDPIMYSSCLSICTT